MHFRRLASCAVLTALIAGCAEVRTPPADSALLRPVSTEDFDHALLSAAVFEESNRARAAHGVPRLAPSKALDNAADEQAWHMALVFRAEHGNPIHGEHTVGERVERAGLYGALRVAENAIMMPARRAADAPVRDYTYREYAAMLVDSWLNSPAHRANLLDPNFSHLGCAARIARGVPGDQRVFATQVFYLTSSAKAPDG